MVVGVVIPQSASHQPLRLYILEVYIYITVYMVSRGK